MSEYIETQFVEKLQSTKLSMQLDESTMRDREVVLLAYGRYISKGEFAEEMIFCKLLETTTTATDIYGKLKNYLNVDNIPIENIISCEMVLLLCWAFERVLG